MSFDELGDDVAFAPDNTPAPDRTAVSIRRSIASVEASLTEFEKISAGLEALHREHPIDLVFDVSTTKGMAEAVAHRAAWRDPRITVEKFRKAAKAPVLTLGKDIDARAAWLTEQLLLGETPVDEQIKAEQERKAQEKADREAKEFGRIVAMQEAIAEIAMSAMVAGKSSTEISARLDAMKATQLDPLVYQEMMPQAQEARIAAIGKLEQGLKAAQWDEAEAARRAAEAEALRVKREAEDAERARVSAEQAAEAARLVEARALIAKAEREAAETLEKERKALAAEKAAWLAEQEAARKAAAPPPAAPEPIAEPRPLYLPLAAVGVTVDHGPLISVRDATGQIVQQVTKQEFVDRYDTAPAPAIQFAEPEPPPETAPPLSIGDLCARLGFGVTAAFLVDTLGFEPVESKGRAVLFKASAWPRIKSALVGYIEGLPV